MIRLSIESSIQKNLNKEIMLSCNKEKSCFEKNVFKDWNEHFLIFFDDQ